MLSQVIPEDILVEFLVLPGDLSDSFPETVTSAGLFGQYGPKGHVENLATIITIHHPQQPTRDPAEGRRQNPPAVQNGFKGSSHSFLLFRPQPFSTLLAKGFNHFIDVIHQISP